MPSAMNVAMRGVGVRSRGLAMAAVAAVWVMGLPVGTMAQANAGSGFHVGGPVVAVTYDVERAKIAYVGCGCFWLQGGGVDVGVPLYKGLGLAGSFYGGHASNIQPGVNLSKLSYMAGPRYTYATGHLGGTTGSAPSLQIFGEALFGGAHGFDGTFPAMGGVMATANSYAMQFGGGVDVAFHGGFGIRAIEADYERTALPNNGTNTQNDLRLGFGVSYRFGRR